jgi:serine/threonine-protein kinase HipA
MTTIISRPLYVYLQRPDTGEWVTVGRYLGPHGGAPGQFLYAPSYADAGLAWPIDPVNLKFRPDVAQAAPRYGGLHDVLRDACPDAWGQALLRREHGLPDGTPALRYLTLSSNAERWGALAVGSGRRPSVAALASPRLPQLAVLVEELAAMGEQRPPVDAGLRKRLVQTASVGGARPKATVQDEHGQYWLVKPRIATDSADIPRLEHMAQAWGAASGLDFAPTVLHTVPSGRSAVRVLRFDRDGWQRRMCVSAASLLQVEYPGAAAEADRGSYPRLAEELRNIGAPDADLRELFGRMVFNALCGNDDDHVRNHAVVYRHEQLRWRLAPAFDVVPNPAETPRALALQFAAGRFDISRDAALAEATRFGFNGRAEAAAWLDGLLARVRASFDQVAPLVDADWARVLAARLAENVQRLAG